MYEERNNKGLIIIIISVIAVVLLIILLLVFSKKGNTFSDDFITPSKSKYKILIYEDEKEAYFVEDESKSKYIYYCNNKNCQGKSIFANAKFAIILDGDNYVIYNYKENKYKSLNIKSNENITGFEIGYYNNNVYSVMVSNTYDYYKIYSLSENKYISEYKYKDFEYNSISLKDDKLICITNIDDESAKYEVISLKNGEILFSVEGLYYNNRMYSFGDDNNIYYVVTTAYEDKYNYTDEYYDSYSYKIYDSNFKLLFDTNYNNISLLSDGNIITKLDDTKYTIHDGNGKLIKTSGEYKEIISFVKDYIILIDYDNSIKLYDYKGNFIVNLAENQLSYVFHTDLFKYENDTLYVVIEDLSLEDSNSRVLLINYSFKTNKIKKVYTNDINNIIDLNN